METTVRSDRDRIIEAMARAILEDEKSRGSALPESQMRWEHKAEAEAALNVALPLILEALAGKVREGRIREVFPELTQWDRGFNAAVDAVAALIEEGLD